MSTFRRYSFLIGTALVMGVAWLTGSRFGGPWPALAVAGSGLGMALIQRRLRGGTSDVTSLAELDQGSGRRLPLLLFIYSDLCGGSLAAQPVIKGLERELAGRAQVVRLNIAEPPGAEAEARYGATKVPVILVLDTDGTELYRTEGKVPRRQALLDALDQR
jgi:hypothetical protein